MAANALLEGYKKTKEKLDNWPLMSCSHEEKVEWFRDVIGARITQVLLSNDRVTEIVVVDDLYDVASEALEDMPLPDSFPDQQNITRDQLAREFSNFCKGLVIRTATLESMYTENDDVPPDLQFIGLVTEGMRIRRFIEDWDRSIGFTAGLRAVGCPFNFSFEELKLLFGFSHLMRSIAQRVGEGYQPQPENANEFKIG